MQEISTPVRAATERHSVSGEFIDFAGERFYAIRNVERMSPFFVSIISNVNHWLFVSSTGGISAGRTSPETSLFPYITVDKIHESSGHTGSKTLLRLNVNGIECTWEPFEYEPDHRYSFTRSVYKNVLGNKICFEEINHDLQLAFRYTWMTSDDFGFIRRCELENLDSRNISVDIVDGLQNILPAGTPRFVQSKTSNLVDAYKWAELDQQSGLASFSLYSGITDRADPCESLRANTVFCLGIDKPKTLISSEQLGKFRTEEPLESEFYRRGIRGAYLINHTLDLAPNTSRQWQFVADIEQDQAKVVALLKDLASPTTVARNIERSIADGSDELARVMAAADGFQVAAEEPVVEHHYANVLFNVLRGGTFDDQYMIQSADFTATVKHFNNEVFQRNQDMLLGLPDKLSISALAEIVTGQNDQQLERLRREYLPIFFGRRHGDPSRPWNEFAIDIKDDKGKRLLSYQGNWRDIFQNWEALTFSYPEFVENIIAKFVNASTMDGYNPYRITKQGIDWEVEELDNPWSFIGYWGDHQIIYLQKFLELSRDFHPNRLKKLLRERAYSYANVPYRIKSFAAMLEDPKNTVEFDNDTASIIDSRISTLGADGKLVIDAAGNVFLVNLLEKLLVPLLSKLGNFVPDGGIWLNTQRPEWNDANNALVGHGLSMVTLYYLRRYIRFLDALLATEIESVELSDNVASWLIDTAEAFVVFRESLKTHPRCKNSQYLAFEELGKAACKYRRAVYDTSSSFDIVEMAIAPIQNLLKDAGDAIDQSMTANVRDDGLYNAYNLLRVANNSVSVDTLYLMLEGQVAALSAGVIGPDQAVEIIDALFESDIYRHDQQSFMLYPDRKLASFLQKNCIPDADANNIALLKEMLACNDTRIVVRDRRGTLRFNAEFSNISKLEAALDSLTDIPKKNIDSARPALHRLYEQVFNHQKFTGRSGGMFGFEGLGSIYWHMVSKLLLAVQENFFSALEQGAPDSTVACLGNQYYRVRNGIGFNKTPAEYGAFPCDPYSHTPKHAGARQPGMTGQVKEEVITRFGELGIRVRDGRVEFRTNLLRKQEFLDRLKPFRYLDVDGNWQQLIVPANSLAFTWCQVPIIYELRSNKETRLRIYRDDGCELDNSKLSLSTALSQEVFTRSGRIRQIHISLSADSLFVT